jgi:hypothetical protein
MQHPMTIDSQGGRCGDACAGADSKVAEVLKLTQEMFGGRAMVEHQHDPDFPESVFIVFNIAYAAEPPEIVARHIEWHERVDKLVPGNSFRLCPLPQ